MAATSSPVALFGIALMLAGCTSSESLWPSLAGEPNRPAARAVDTAPLAPPPPRMGAIATAQPAAAVQIAAAPSATFVGQKVQQLRGDLQRLQTSVDKNGSSLRQVRESMLMAGQSYFSNIGAINARLQVGTTPGNPNLVQQWNQAQSDLERINDGVGQLNNIAGQVAGDSSMAAFLLDATRASYSISGAFDEDHRALSQLEDDVNRTVVVIDRLLAEISDDVSRQTAYVGSERRNLTTLAVAVKNGELFGSSLANRAAPFGAGGASPALGASFSMPASPAVRGDRRPLVVIRFDRQSPQYQQALYNAVSQALERRPDTSFDLVAVTPTRGQGQGALSATAARRNAEAVFRALTDMGLPAARVNLSATSSPTADVNEVHVFVR